MRVAGRVAPGAHGDCLLCLGLRPRLPKNGAHRQEPVGVGGAATHEASLVLEPRWISRVPGAMTCRCGVISDLERPARS